MRWYKEITKQQKQDFKKVIIVCAIGTLFILFIPTVFNG